MNLSLRQWAAGIALVQSITVLAKENLEDIPMAYLIVAKSYQVPADILYSMALVESGKVYKEKKLPWPWALNIDGQSVFCDSQQEAISRISQAIKNKQLVDIGLMQISWRWQKQRFSNPGEALVPIHNLKAGAIILREQFEHNQLENKGDWWDAVGRYHDPGQDAVSLGNAKQYRDKVKKYWQETFL